MSLFKMTVYRAKKILAWLLAFALLGLIAAGVYYVAVVV